MTTFKDVTSRAVRTFLQAALAFITTSGLLIAFSTSGKIDLDALQVVGIGAAFSGLAALVAFLQNWLETTGKIPPLLKPQTVPVKEANARIEEAFMSEPNIGEAPVIPTK